MHQKHCQCSSIWRYIWIKSDTEAKSAGSSPESVLAFCTLPIIYWPSLSRRKQGSAIACLVVRCRRLKGAVVNGALKGQDDRLRKDLPGLPVVYNCCEPLLHLQSRQLQRLS